MRGWAGGAQPGRWFELVSFYLISSVNCGKKRGERKTFWGLEKEGSKMKHGKEEKRNYKGDR